MPARRAGRVAALAAGVLAAHLWLATDVLAPQLGEGAAADGRSRRIEVSFVRELAQSSAARARPAAATPPPRRTAAPAAAPASAAASAPAAAAVDAPVAVAAAAPEPAAEPAPPDPPASAASAVAAALAAAPAAQPASATATATAFEWPPSTRLSYRLTGNYRGPVEGQARVEWLRSGVRYQVFMDVSIGPSFAPLMSRRVSSDGEITPEGLSPRRYDEETKAVLMDTRRLSIALDPDRVRMPDGSNLPRPPGVQDSASQFVQLTWLFTTRPELLETGRSIEIPLLLPRGIQPWFYDVVGTETLHTAAGVVETVHVKPRREATSSTLTAEMWVAPSLQYLPVRILIRQSADTFIDLLVERLPEQAAVPAGKGPARDIR